ncbi:LPXTG cell wall anchor domain-containing protein [Lacticaseibacillus daqingensis]|uniref:LPXTG cell wall anchor domain-containing protein n=1 Tax=Lacticaseibacillus daqingensis TaxID=2486014 RepID=UPI0013DDF02D|nr:LPXTG cell wall anchor domain-containing protein [Lacticaseibacillus daqingensis]
MVSRQVSAGRWHHRLRLLLISVVGLLGLTRGQGQVAGASTAPAALVGEAVGPATAADEPETKTIHVNLVDRVTGVLMVPLTYTVPVDSGVPLEAVAQAVPAGYEMVLEEVTYDEATQTYTVPLAQIPGATKTIHVNLVDRATGVLMVPLTYTVPIDSGVPLEAVAQAVPAGYEMVLEEVTYDEATQTYTVPLVRVPEPTKTVTVNLVDRTTQALIKRLTETVPADTGVSLATIEAAVPSDYVLHADEITYDEATLTYTVPISRRETSTQPQPSTPPAPAIPQPTQSAEPAPTPTAARTLPQTGDRQTIWLSALGLMILAVLGGYWYRSGRH